MALLLPPPPLIGQKARWARYQSRDASSFRTPPRLISDHVLFPTPPFGQGPFCSLAGVEGSGDQETPLTQRSALAQKQRARHFPRSRGRGIVNEDSWPLWNRCHRMESAPRFALSMKDRAMAAWAIARISALSHIIAREGA